MLRAARQDEGNDDANDGDRARGGYVGARRRRRDGVAAQDSERLVGARGARRQAGSRRGAEAARGRLAAPAGADAGGGRRRVRRDRGGDGVEVDGAGRRRRGVLRSGDVPAGACVSRAGPPRRGGHRRHAGLPVSADGGRAAQDHLRRRRGRQRRRRRADAGQEADPVGSRQEADPVGRRPAGPAPLLVVVPRRCAQAIEQMPQDLDARVPLAVAADDLPRRVRRVGLVEHLLGGVDVFVPVLAVAPVLGADLPALVGIVLALLETPLLLVLGDGQEHLHQDHAVVDELALELVDLAVGALPRLLLAELLHALDEHAPVPGAIEDSPAAVLGHARPEAPQVVVLLLLVRRRADGVDVIAARVELLGHALDGAALARGVPAFEGEDDGPLAFARLELGLQDLELQLGERALVRLLVGHLRVVVELVQDPHEAMLHSRRALATRIPARRDRRWRAARRRRHRRALAVGLSPRRGDSVAIARAVAQRVPGDAGGGAARARRR